LAELWTGARRPLLMAAVLGCAISLMTAGRLTARLIGPAAVYWSFVPLLQIAGLWVVCRGAPGAKRIDRFLASNAPWLLWTTAFAAVWGLGPSPWVIGRTWFSTFWYVLAGAAAVWAGIRDYRFSRQVLGRAHAQALGDVAMERMVAWPAGLAIFLWSSGSQVVASVLGL
jgi:hypothetical protein